MGKYIIFKTLALGLFAGSAIVAGSFALTVRKNKKTPPRSNPATTSYPDYALSEHTFVSPTSGRTISFAEYGDPKSKNVVIYEHGNPGSRVLPVGPTVVKGKDIRVLAMDRPGIGFTSLPVDGKTVIETAVSDVAELLEYLEIPDKVILCGFSAGGPHVLAIMATIPDKIKAVYCLGPAGYFDEPITWTEVSPGSKSANWYARYLPTFYYYDIIYKASAITDCSNVIANMSAFSSKGDAIFLAEHPIEAQGWANVNYEAYRQGLEGYARSCVEIFGAEAKGKPWPILGDIASLKGLEGQRVTIFHRESDQLVALSGSRDLVKRLKAASVDAELIAPEGPVGGHFSALNDGFELILKRECSSSISAGVTAATTATASGKSAPEAAASAVAAAMTK
ncbi:Alpha/Beta hydrolase protein [Lipomyces oligophaga]|uniref:Alpha/Beta hydrolase protein n=1 Tax=Lipomyces oligophaga TaxID=45792 RepID=UPI0034CED3A8